MFYDREEEIEFLKGVLRKERKVFVVLYGRRRVGKTTLVKRVIGEGGEYFFVEVKRPETLLREFSKRISRGTFESWYDFFTELFEKRDVIVFDEFQNFMRVDEGILYSLQHAWDDLERPVKLIAVGSYVGMMKRIFTDAKMPLFGRKDYIINLKPFGVSESVEMLKNFGYDVEEALMIYAMVGGVPPYLLLFENVRPFEELVRDVFVSRFAPLRDEAKNILVLEFGSEHRSYFSILEAIGARALTLSEISDSTGMDKNKLSKYIDELTREYQILEASRPLLSKNGKRRKYRIADRFYAFYYHVIHRLKSLIELAPERAVEEIVSRFPTYMGLTFEEICAEYFSQNHQILGFIPLEIGKSWGRVPGKRRESFDIDVVAYDDENVAVVECKWTGKPVGFEIYEKLRERASFLDLRGRRVKYVIVSKSGFADDLLRASGEDLILLTPEDMFGR